jgi:RNA polymerase sigma-70 factor (ECF subfamily)
MPARLTRVSTVPSVPVDDLDSRDLERLSRGDARALRPLWEAYGDRVYRLCARILGQRADAEDATQEVFLRILAKASSFSGRSRFSTWVYRLTVNHCLNDRARRGRHWAPLDDERLPPATGASAVSAVEARDRLDALLARLAPDHRAVLLLREVEGLSYAECAEVLEVPVGTVMSRLSRARKALMRAAPASDAERPVPAPTGTNGWQR